MSRTFICKCSLIFGLYFCKSLNYHGRQKYNILAVIVIPLVHDKLVITYIEMEIEIIAEIQSLFARKYSSTNLARTSMSCAIFCSINTGVSKILYCVSIVLLFLYIHNISLEEIVNFNFGKYENICIFLKRMYNT